MKKIVWLILLLSVSVYAQTKSAVLKFDEFTDSSLDGSVYPFESVSLSQRIGRLVNQLKRERGTKRVFIIYYRARKTDYQNKDQVRWWADQTKWEVQQGARLAEENVILIDGGYREANTLEYWIAPKNSEPPQATPTFDKSEALVCPDLSIQQEEIQFDKTTPVHFWLSVNPSVKLTYRWKISAGKIIQENWSYIKVDLSEVQDKRITVFVEADGLPSGCEKIVFRDFTVGNQPHLFDSARRVHYSELAARLDGFLSFLYNHPSANGQIIVYADRSRGLREMSISIRSLRSYLAFRNFDLSRISIIEGGFREDNTIDMWVVPAGAPAPAPTPSVDNKFVIQTNKTQKTTRNRK